MIIGVAGPYSAPSEQERKKNLDKLNAAAAALMEMGHIPLIGVNAALPVVEKTKTSDAYKGIMDISLAVIGACEALLLLAESPAPIKNEISFFRKDCRYTVLWMKFQRHNKPIKTKKSRSTNGIFFEVYFI